MREIPNFRKTDYFIMRWSGWLKSESSGLWQFRTNSDDGSQLYIDNKLVVDNDGLHGMQAKGGTANLRKGWHKMVITFFEKNGGAGMEVSVAPPQGQGQAGRQWMRLTAAMTKPGNDVLKAGKAPSGDSSSGDGAGGNHLYFYTINPVEHRCGQVDAATRMPSDMFRKGTRLNRYLKSYIRATERYYSVPHCTNCKVRQGTCVQHGYTQTDPSKPGMNANWPLTKRRQSYYCRFCRWRKTCGLCDTEHNQPAYVTFYYQTGH